MQAMTQEELLQRISLDPAICEGRMSAVKAGATVREVKCAR
jgi:hypothetical protein